MTPTATYIAEENCLQVEPTMKKPAMPVGAVHLSTAYAYERALAEYNAHLATLRKIPCDISCKGLWADGQKVVGGKDYEVRDYPIRAMLPTDPKFIAFPLVPVKSEDEFNLHYEYVGMLAHYLGITINGKDLEEKAFPELKKVFSLTKR